MRIELDHTIVPSRDKVAAARQLAALLGVEWAATTAGPFAAVFVNDGLTLDFIDTQDDLPVYHFCFRVVDADFDAILGRLRTAGIRYRSEVRGAQDMATSHHIGGCGLYWTGTSPTGTSGKCSRSATRARPREHGSLRQRRGCREALPHNAPARRRTRTCSAACPRRCAARSPPRSWA